MTGSNDPTTAHSRPLFIAPTFPIVHHPPRLHVLPMPHIIPTLHTYTA